MHPGLTAEQLFYYRMTLSGLTDSLRSQCTVACWDDASQRLHSRTVQSPPLHGWEGGACIWYMFEGGVGECGTWLTCRDTSAKPSPPCLAYSRWASDSSLWMFAVPPYGPKSFAAASRIMWRMILARIRAPMQIQTHLGSRSQPDSNAGRVA